MYATVQNLKKGKMTDAMLRRISLSTNGYDLARIPPDEEGMEWAYILPPDHPGYGDVFNLIMKDKSEGDARPISFTYREPKDLGFDTQAA